MVSARALSRPIEFGPRYTLRELVAVGGMAEIYRARQSSLAEFQKDVIVKRLKPELAADERMVEMFLDEARVTALLSHPNIVHVYDVDQVNGAPFIVMELIAGQELTAVCRRGLAQGSFLPLCHAVDLVRQAARGLGYVHSKRDAEGRGLEIVHCDISPTNLLVSEDGVLKVIDFGIARSRLQRVRGHELLPGKLSYMAPEQASRALIDHRADIFSLGVVLYELTVGRRLFRGPAEEVVRRVRQADVPPPTFVRPGYPGALESIVMRALERHPDERFDSAYDLADELQGFLRAAGLESGPVAIARYLDSLTVAEGGNRRPELLSEAERRRDEDDQDLDFERGLFDSFQTTLGDSKDRTADWEEYEQDNQVVAEALGVEVEDLDPQGPVPVSPPSRPGPAAVGRTDGPTAGTSAGLAAKAVEAAAPASRLWLAWALLAWAVVATVAAIVGFAL
jgi:serine/threonine protein kinase